MERKHGIMLGGIHIEKAVSDSSFFQLMPEFASIRSQLSTMHAEMNTKKGCSSCNKRRIHANIDGNFVAIASRLTEDRAKVLKKYLGIGEDELLYIRAVNPATHQLIMKQF